MIEQCCFLFNDDIKTPCAIIAEWVIWTPPDPNDLTYACTEHVGALLSDANEFRVYPIAVGE